MKTKRIMALFDQRDRLTDRTGVRDDALVAAIDKELVALGYPADAICDLAEAANRARLARAKEIIDAFQRGKDIPG